MYLCPCCGNLTLSERDHYEICPVCYWEDDPLQSQDATYTGGANTMSLKEAKITYNQVGAVSKDFLQYVRKPKPNELEEWRAYG